MPYESHLPSIDLRLKAIKRDLSYLVVMPDSTHTLDALCFDAVAPNTCYGGILIPFHEANTELCSLFVLACKGAAFFCHKVHCFGGRPLLLSQLLSSR